MEIKEVLTSSIVDLTSLKEFFSSDKDSLIQLIEVYISDTTPKIDELENNLTNFNYDSIRSVCHFLKSSFGLMGINCLDEIALLEKEAQDQIDQGIIKEKLNFVIPICRESIVEYKLILGRLKSL